MQEKFRVYISFAQEDREQVRKLDSGLRTEGFDTWFDEKDLPAGSEWREVIRHALPGCDAFLSCVSTHSVKRAGFYDHEIALALEVLRSRPGFVIPARLDDCEMPAALRDAGLMWVDVFEEAGLQKLFHDLKARAARRMPAVVAGPERAEAPPTKPIRILHLSDLHFKDHDDHEQLLSILDQDLRDSPDYLVVSGDLSDCCNAKGYENAKEFLVELRTRRKIPQQRCILVPGNHDVERDLGSFEVREKADRHDDAVKALVGDLETSLYLVRKTNSYADRFARFAEVHKTFTGRDYDLTHPRRQVGVVVSDEDRLQFLELNSAWEIDQFRPKRASIHPNALDEGVRLMSEKRDYLGIAVWHHAITGNDKIRSDEFLGRLSKCGVRLCLHGDVHEFRPDIVSPYGPSRIHVAGIGTFGAAPNNRPESTPRMFNLIEIERDRTKASISTRQQLRPGMVFDAYAMWSVAGQRDGRSGSYNFTLDPTPAAD